MKVHNKYDASGYSASQGDKINTLIWNTDHTQPSEFIVMQRDVSGYEFYVL